MSQQSSLKEPITVYWEKDGWQPIFPLRTDGATSLANRACLNAELQLKANQKAAVEVNFYVKGDVVVKFEHDGLHFVPNSNAGCKLKVSLKLASGQMVEKGFTWDSGGCGTLNDNV